MASLSCISLQTMQEAPIPHKSVISLGNFDGVHLAHRALLQETKKLRETSFPNASCTVFCFSDSPSDFLSEAPPAHIFDLTEKLECFREEGMEYAILADFSALRELSPQEFVTDILRNRCACVGAVCGYNYRFGKGGEGTARMLSELLESKVCIVPEIVASGTAVSSTRIRRLIANGQVEEAAKLLTKPYSFSSPVQHGKALGRKLGFPTINQFFPPKQIIPRRGVYLTACKLESEETVYGISNVGVHPTVDQDALINCETYLLDFDGDLYGQTVRVSFLKQLREEIKFQDADALKARVFADIELARGLLKTIII